jgi:broad specificity phosphatase PhoE
MKIYFVRHGESEGNVGPFVQGPEEPLTDEGKKQAEVVSRRFLSIPIDVILASPEVRAKTTAEIIAGVINKPLDFSNLLVEFIKPSVIVKKPKKDPEVKEIKKLIKENFHVSGWKHSDEENFEDLRKRASDLLKSLLLRKEENILIVTHGIFMRMIIAVAIMGENLTSHEYWKIFISLALDNTGITVLKSNNTEEYADASPWELITWNDHTHLEDLK